CNRADLVADSLAAFSLDVGGVSRDSRLQHHETDRHLALDLIGNAEYRAFCHIGMRGEYFLHAASRQAMARNIDDVVGAGHDVDIAILIDEACIGGLVIAWEVLEIALAE